MWFGDLNGQTEDLRELPIYSSYITGNGCTAARERDEKLEG